MPELIDEQSSTVACLRWDAPPDASATDAQPADRTEVLIGDSLPLPQDARAVPFIPAEGGEQVLADYFYGPPGDGAVVQIRAAGRPAGPGTRYLVTDTGTRFGIDSVVTAETLGLGPGASPVPASILSLLPQGPALDVASARRSHNSVIAVDDGAALPGQ